MIEIFLTKFPDLGFGYDVKITDEAATLGDYLTALDEFQEKYVAACRGCDGCCWERVPLGIVDYFLGTAPFEGPCDLPAWLKKVATMAKAGGAVDLYLKRDDDSACIFLDQTKKECNSHLARPLVCRTHTCLPKSGLALELRSTIVNALEDDLVRRLLLEFNEKHLNIAESWQKILAGSEIKDYPPNVFSSYDLIELKNNWLNIRIKDIINVELWQELCQK